MLDDDQPITVINRAKSQFTLADYELAQEEFNRKTRAREEARRRGDTYQPGAKTPATVEQIKQLLLHPDLTAADRAMLERALDEAAMAGRFAQPQR